MRLRRSLSAVCLLGCTLALGQELPPRDESGRDPSFAAFLAKLRETVRRQDTAGLMRIVSPTIQTSFGDDGGEEHFRMIWELEKPGSKVWGVLDRAFRLGIAYFPEGTLCAPYFAFHFPPDLDSFEHYIVAGTEVRLREAGSAQAPELARMSYTIVRLLEYGDEWSSVRLLDGRTGFVASQYLYSPVGYRACFSRNDEDQWQMALLVAGD